MFSFTHDLKNKNRARLAVFMLCLLMVPILACVAESKEGELPPDCLPVTANLYGEIDPTWSADVVPEQAYLLDINSQKYPLNQLNVTIYSIEKDGRVLIVDGRGTDTEDQLQVSFIGPKSGRILIKFIALIGADGEGLGEFSMKLCEE